MSCQATTSNCNQSVNGLFDIPAIEMPLWFFVTLMALWPSQFTFFVVFFQSIPLSQHDILFVLCAFTYTIIALVTRPRIQTKFSLRSVFFVLFVLYVMASTFWGQQDSEVRNYALTHWMMFVSSIIIPCIILRRINSGQIENLFSRITVFLSAISLLYLILVLDPCQLRASCNLRLDQVRLQGPLINAAVGAFILLPPLAWAIHMAISFHNHQIKILGRTCAIILSICIFMLGSRIALVCVACFLLLLIWHYPKLLPLLLALSILLGGLFFVFMSNEETVVAVNTQRMLDFKTDYREQSYLTCLNILSSQSPEKLLRGAGLSRYWSWYIRPRSLVNRPVIGADTYPAKLLKNTLVATEHGPLLWACHSAVLWHIVEFGLIGVIALVYVFGKVFYWAIPKSQSKYLPYLFLGLAASSLNNLTASPCYICPILSVIWFIFFLGGERLFINSNIVKNSLNLAPHLTFPKNNNISTPSNRGAKSFHKILFSDTGNL